MIIRALDPISDRELLATAYGWARNTPRWFREMDAVFGKDDFEAYLKASQNGGCDIGIFDPELVCVIILSEQPSKRYECHLMAPRTANAIAIIEGAIRIKDELFRRGANDICAWVASKNYPLLRMVEAMGLYWDDTEMLRGVYHEKVIMWQRMAQNRVQWEDGKQKAA